MAANRLELNVVREGYLPISGYPQLLSPELVSQITNRTSRVSRCQGQKTKVSPARTDYRGGLSPSIVLLSVSLSVIRDCSFGAIPMLSPPQSTVPQKTPPVPSRRS